jgi:hypothetical protein
MKNKLLIRINIKNIFLKNTIKQSFILIILIEKQQIKENDH